VFGNISLSRDVWVLCGSLVGCPLLEPRGWAKMGTTWGQMWGPKLDQSVDQKWDQRVDQKWDQRVDPKWDQRVDQKCFFVLLWGRRNLVKSCCDSFAKEQFCMKTMKIKKCVTIWVAGLSLGVFWADGLGRGLGPLFGPRGGLAEETDGWAGGTGPDRPGCPCWARAGGREGSRTYCLAACSDAFQ